MMKPRFLFLLILLPILVSCQTEIEYAGEITEPRFVVFARSTFYWGRHEHRCYVQQSTFFLDDTPSGHSLSDATVEWQLNDGTRYPFTFVADSDCFLPSSPLPFAYSANDRITFYISHPKYGTTSATQTIPAIQSVPWRVVQSVTDTLNESYQKEEDSTLHIVTTRQRLEINLMFPAYRFHPDDVVEITARAVYHPTADSTYQRKAYLSSNHPLYHSLTTDSDLGIISDIGSLFSDENRRYDAFYIPASSLQEEQKTALNIYTPSQNETANTILLTVRTMTHDAWLYYLSMAQQSSLKSSIIGLGQEEKVQIYGNFNNEAIGVYITTTEQTLTIPIHNAFQP
ncbi:MAG: DUF4249 family protein [Paludibacteraceae bacterium]|nr:DUF4249 family protein [Paludibacteraceae bacterium]